MGNDLIQYRISIGTFYYKCYSVLKKKMLYYVKTFSLFSQFVQFVLYSVKISLDYIYKFAFCNFCVDISFTFIMLLLILLCNDVAENPGPYENEISIFHLNARSVRTKVEYIETLALGSSIVCITESHLDENVSSEDIHMDGYHQELYRNDRNCFGGGVLVYVSEILKTKRRFDLEFENGELIWLEIDFPQHKILLCAIYRSPGSSHPFWQNFKHSIEQAYNYTTKIIITGDLNVDLFTEHNHVLNDLMNIFCLQNVVKEATRFDHRSGRATLLDPILISEDCCATFTEVIDINRQMSDHNATKVYLRIPNFSENFFYTNYLVV